MLQLESRLNLQDLFKAASPIWPLPYQVAVVIVLVTTGKAKASDISERFLKALASKFGWTNMVKILHKDTLVIATGSYLYFHLPDSECKITYTGAKKVEEITSEGTDLVDMANLKVCWSTAAFVFLLPDPWAIVACLTLTTFHFSGQDLAHTSENH